MIHDESRCNGCNICARACRKTNHVPAQGSRLSIAHIPVTDNDNETQYHFFRQSCQHCEDAPCIDVCPTAASWRDEQGIVRVEKSQCIGCSYCIGACPYQVRYLNPVTKVADKCDFCAESRLAKGFPPICVSACPEHALILVAKIAQKFRRGCRKINTINISYLVPGNRTCIAGSVNI